MSRGRAAMTLAPWPACGYAPTKYLNPLPLKKLSNECIWCGLGASACLVETVGQVLDALYAFRGAVPGRIEIIHGAIGDFRLVDLRTGFGKALDLLDMR